MGASGDTELPERVTDLQSLNVKDNQCAFKVCDSTNNMGAGLVATGTHRKRN